MLHGMSGFTPEQTGLRDMTRAFVSGAMPV
jgi:hypothetical protein